MTRDETKKLIRGLTALYPNWKPSNLTDTVDVWQWALQEYSQEAVQSALTIYIKTNGTGFAPSVSQLIDCMHAPKENSRLTEGEAWALVLKAIRNSGYNSEKEFAMLPAPVQKAVGNASMLRQWAMCDSDEVNTVIMSNFQRSYRVCVDRERFTEKIPPRIGEVLSQIGEKHD